MDESSIELEPRKLVDGRQPARVTGYIRAGIDEGATPLVGGDGVPAGLDRGCYVTPTHFTDVDDAMTIAREEIAWPAATGA